VELTDNPNLVEMLKIVCKRLGCKENFKMAKLYNKNGIPLFQDDLVLLNHEDVCYIALKGNCREHI
jgi:hypothetical protein